MQGADSTPGPCIPSPLTDELAAAPDEAARQRLLVLHPRFPALTAKYGPLAAAPAGAGAGGGVGGGGAAAGTSLARSMVKLVLCHGGKEVRKKLPGAAGGCGAVSGEDVQQGHVQGCVTNVAMLAWSEDAGRAGSRSCSCSASRALAAVCPVSRWSAAVHTWGRGASSVRLPRFQLLACHTRVSLADKYVTLAPRVTGCPGGASYLPCRAAPLCAALQCR